MVTTVQETEETSGFNYYDLEDVEREKHIASVKSRIQKQTDDTLIKKMMSIVERDVKHYKTDFYVHDFEMYRFFSGSPFLWIVRKNGTHFLNLMDDWFTKDEWNVGGTCRAILRGSAPIKAIYSCSEGKMVKINEQKAKELLDIYERKAIARLEAAKKKEEILKQEEWLSLWKTS